MPIGVGCNYSKFYRLLRTVAVTAHYKLLRKDTRLPSNTILTPTVPLEDVSTNLRLTSGSVLEAGFETILKKSMSQSKSFENGQHMSSAIKIAIELSFAVLFMLCSPKGIA